jgi:glycosyltransferase involved in cell wall biosynthesis
LKEKVAIIVPCFNEEENITGVIDDILANAPQNEEWHIIMVNDCSTDDTLAKLQADGRAIILDLPCNSGVGAAVQTGFKYASANNFDYAVKFDGDGQHRGDYISVLLDALKNAKADFVIGSRFIEKNSEGFKSTAARRFGIRFLQVLIKLFTGYSASDPTSGFRAYNKKALRFATRYYPSFDYPEPEEIVLMQKNGFKVMDIFTEMRERQGGKSSISACKAVYYMLKVGFAIFMVSLRSKEQGVSL